MTLDSSVMNMAIATVAKDVGTTVTGDPDGDHALLAGDGDADDPRWQGGRADRAGTPGRPAHRARGPGVPRADCPVLLRPEPHPAARICQDPAIRTSPGRRGSSDA